MLTATPHHRGGRITQAPEHEALASAVDRRPPRQEDRTRSACQPIAGAVLSCEWTAATDHPTVHIRHHVAEALHALGFAQDRIDDVVLAASELAANATEHAEGPYRLLLHNAGPTYLLECHDHSSTLPPVDPRPAPPTHDSPLSEPDADALLTQMGERGRGLAMLSHLSNGRLSAQTTPTGKKVLVTLIRDARKA